MRHVPNFVVIGQTVSEIIAIFSFSRRRPNFILDCYKFDFLNGSRVQRVTMCNRVPKFVAIGQVLPRYGDFSFFSICRPSAILDSLCSCLDHLLSGLYLFLQNLLGTDAVLSVICMFLDFASLALKCLFTSLKLGYGRI